MTGCPNGIRKQERVVAVVRANVDDAHPRFEITGKKKGQPQLPVAIQHQMTTKTTIMRRQEHLEVPKYAGKDKAPAEIGGLGPLTDGLFCIFTRHFNQLIKREIIHSAAPRTMNSPYIKCSTQVTSNPKVQAEPAVPFLWSKGNSNGDCHAVDCKKQ